MTSRFVYAILLTSALAAAQSSGTSKAAGTMTMPRSGHTATLLADGRILITGGANSNNGWPSALKSAEVYDPDSGLSRPTGDMTSVRTQHTATLLPDGRVLIAGGLDGYGPGGDGIDSAEIYDPSSGTFSPAGKMTHPRYGHTATLLNNGKV